MITVKKFDSSGRELGVTSRAEAIVAVMRHDPTQVPTLLSEFGFSRIADIPFREKERLEGLAIKDFPRMIQAGMVFQVDSVAKVKKNEREIETLKKQQKKVSVQTQSWTKSKSWKITQLLEIFSYLAESRRLEIRYSLDRAGNEKSLTGLVKFETDVSDPNNSGCARFVLLVDGKKIALFDDLITFSLTKLD